MTEPTKVQINPLVALDETVRRTDAAAEYSRNRILFLSQRVFDLTEANEQLAAKVAALTGAETEQDNTNG